MQWYYIYCISIYASSFRKLRHPNIVNLMGVCYEVSQLLLVTNYINGSNLEQIIFNKSLDVSESHMSCISIKTILFPA